MPPARPSGELGEIHRLLGELNNEAKALRRDMEAGELRAVDGRARLHASVEKLDERVDQLAADGRAVNETLTKIKPFAEKVDRWEQRGIGAVAVIGMFGMMLGGLIVLLWSEILSFIRFLTGVR